MILDVEKVFVRVLECKIEEDCFFNSSFFSTAFFELSLPFALVVEVLSWWIVVGQLISCIDEATMMLAKLITC